MKNIKKNKKINTFWRGSVFTDEEPPLWGVESCSPEAGGPTQSQLSRSMSSGHHISMEHRLRRRQLNSDTNATNKTYLKEIQEKRKEETFFFRKKEGPKRYLPRRLKNIFFKKKSQEIFGTKENRISSNPENKKEKEKKRGKKKNEEK